MKTHVPKLQRKQAEQKEKERVARVIRAGLNNDYREVFGTPAGTRVLNDLLGMTHQFQTSFSYSGNSQIEFREGERNIGIKIIERMNKVNQGVLFDAFKMNLKQEYLKK